jgi:hypothetical protein
LSGGEGDAGGFRRAAIREAFAKQQAFCETVSPLYAEVFAACADALGPGAARPAGRALLALLEEAWSHRDFPNFYEAPLLLAAALHEAVLASLPSAAPLAAFYSTAGGRFARRADAPALRRALDALWLAPPPTFLPFLAQGFVQTNEPSRGVAWLLPACALTAWLGQPIDLVDLGCSAGLNLAADRLSWSWTWEGESGTRTWWLGEDGEPIRQTLDATNGAEVERLLHLPPGECPSPDVRRRIGIDRAPVDLRRPEAARRLAACIWPDQTDRWKLFERAVAAHASLDPPPQLIRADLAAGLRRIAPVLGTARAPRIVLLYSTIATGYLTDEAYAALRGRVAEVFAGFPEGFTGLWIEMEPPRDELSDSPVARHTAHLLEPGGLGDLTLAVSEPHPRNLRLERGWEALRERLAKRSA